MKKVLAELRKVFEVQEIQPFTYQIDTTFHLPGGTELILYLILEGRNVTLTDGGIFMDEVILSMEEELNTQLFDNIGATITEDGFIEKETSVRKATKEVFRFIEAIMDTSILYAENH